jgi:hypothetical protein
VTPASLGANANPGTDECSPGAFVHLKTDDAFRKKLLGGRHIRSHCPIDFTEDMAFSRLLKKALATRIVV